MQSVQFRLLFLSVSNRHWGPLPSWVIGFALLLSGAHAFANGAFIGIPSHSDTLLDIVSHCVDTGSAHYCNSCAFPRADAACALQPPRCDKSTDVWRLSSEFVAIRDIKMCGCPPNFVHGLALPRKPVRGVEDPKRPEGIWPFAWDVASSTMAATDIALVVNPRSERSQNQLHVHMLRLRTDARQSLHDYPQAIVSNLSHVWATAAQLAQVNQLQDYGVLVAAGKNDKFVVLVSAHSPEALFGLWWCQ